MSDVDGDQYRYCLCMYGVLHAFGILGSHDEQYGGAYSNHHGLCCYAGCVLAKHEVLTCASASMTCNSVVSLLRSWHAARLVVMGTHRAIALDRVDIMCLATMLYELV